MSILIKGMEMPKNCRQCSLYLQSMDSERNVYENCAVTAKSYNWGLTTRPSDCPLVPVPEHGRLIDADARVNVQVYNDEFEDFQTVNMSIDDLLDSSWIELEDDSTIIPAEEVKES